LLSESIPAVYENLWLLTQQMLNAARSGRWEALIEVEFNRNILIEQMMAQGESSIMSAIEQRKISGIIRDILAADSEIKALTEAWKGELKNILDSVDTEKKLNKAYVTP
jgi:hypothetical protein